MMTGSSDADTLRQQLKASHSPEQIRKRLAQRKPHSYLKDFVYGAVDGTVTTFAVVSGVAGAGLAPKVILVMGLANLLADGFSMAVSNFLGVRAEKQQVEKARAEELLHIAVYPEGEAEEVRQIFANKGFTGEVLEQIVRIITSSKKQWADTMLQEEYAYPLERANPWKAALSTFTSFITMGLVPVFPFVWNFLVSNQFRDPFLWSCLCTLVAFFFIGAIKSRFISKSWYLSGLETLVLGGAAATLAFFAGNLLKGL
ncbi:VIT1/CCC1 family predicted Fe2+/Mn2+ transporter [Pontibacter ummariensis]|uniref:Predicted Fe2+/Mn2+ transporter, VIT1/CCC1 family n=1 Tax=Pontibacter ummariensis TaxID=1610492 RepID=A0A239JWW4_9BACT|nr:VIT1/CCC1 transporter family protein [Pontibacter ummariensis]PRY07285.1 VIT1/CCC1 family predicted Fe2+/Mn2+ transporter [Pontibacter ummariensis]SNT10456.1 Predicted Fe2+/Mn2+ transporter, VIT1/CCC1 family [Pontibacter ummariensis]